MMQKDCRENVLIETKISIENRAKGLVNQARVTISAHVWQQGQFVEDLKDGTVHRGK